MQNIQYLIALVISEILICVVSLFIRKKDYSKNQIKKIFNLILGSMFVWTLSLIFQILMQNSNVSPIIFEGFASFGACFLPVLILFLGLAFAQTKIQFKRIHLLLFIIPVISTILMFTNDLHHLFIKSYSTNVNECVYGPYLILNTLYTYSMYLIGLLYLMKYSIKNSGFFSKQSILIILACLVPIIINSFGTFGILPMTVYVTPISFTVSILFFALAIFKFNFLSVAPIALQRIVDRMSDAYIVIDEEYIITDFNEAFLNKSHIKEENVRGKKIFELIEAIPKLSVDEEKLKQSVARARITKETITFEKYIESLNRHFNIEISSIMNKNTFLGTLILFKDITQHVVDMQTIKDNQDLLVEKERLAGLGQMIGGIAHNLKTPIMSISGAAEGIIDLIKEYEASVGNPIVTEEDHHEIAKEMYEWIEKIKSYDGYMSDVITAVKGQAVALSDNDENKFTIKELIKYIDILMKHELKNALINLKINVEVEENLRLTGNVNSLVQVINNIVSNSIQAYGERTNEDILLNVSREEDNLLISVKDFACGMSKEVQDSLFKKMITTKGKNGTGLGMFMSYSNIKAHFNGNMTFESQEGVGTTFYITIPIR